MILDKFQNSDAPIITITYAKASTCCDDFVREHLIVLYLQLMERLSWSRVYASQMIELWQDNSLSPSRNNKTNNEKASGATSKH